MPRASASSKRQQGAASHRDSRHDSGLVVPGKRVTPKKSHSQLDGSAAAAAAAAAADHVASHAAPSSLTPSASTSSLLPQLQLPPQSVPNGAPSALSAKNPGYLDAHAAVSDQRSGDALSRPSVVDYSETSSESCQSNVGGSGLVESGYRQIDVNAMKNTDVHRDSGPLELAITVLKSLPIQDTLAILIILMHVPSLSLTIIYAAFTLLTFVPPVTTSSGMNINLAEMFDGNSTMPSLVTIGCMDCVFLLMWLFLWQPIQALILDFAKPVIAITLGGGTSARDGTSRGVTTCFTGVLIQHLLRGTRSHWSRLFLQIPEEWRIPAFLGDPFDSMASVYDKRNPHGLIRSVLAIHILTQGIVRYIREWYLKREKAHAASGMTDPEAGKLLSGTGDGSNEAGFNTPDTDGGLQPIPLPATSKKRRKQSAQVRLQQPLWAALASTKIVVMKEYELSHAASEAAGTNATDIHNLGNAPFDTQPNQIWISYVGSDELCFSTSYFPNHPCGSDQQAKISGHTGRPAGLDASKPFYVRVNNALWQPTRLFPVEDSEGDNNGWTRWSGDIYGLRPVSKYVCEFVDSQTDKVLLTTSIRTVQETLRENDGIAPPVPEGSQSLQPDSPTTTLKTSIAAADARLSEEKNKLKLLRKDCKAKGNAVKKEIELTDNQLSSAGNHDEKYRQKIRQQETQKAQAERDTERLGGQVKSLDASPEGPDRKKKVERAYSAEKKAFDGAQKGFKEYKTQLEGGVKAKEVDNSNLNTRRNKVATRIAKVEHELANLTDANIRGLDEAERRRAQRQEWEGQCANIASNYDERMSHVRDANGARLEYIRGAQAQLSSFHEYLNSANGIPYDVAVAQGLSQPPQQQQQQQASIWNPNPTAQPHFPGGMWHGSDLPQSMSPMSGGRSGSSTWHPPPTAPAFEPRGYKFRGRSSSMLSDVSGFTQSSDGEQSASPYGPNRKQYEQTWGHRAGGNRSSGSTGSGSGSGSGIGSGSGSGSTGEPSSPT